MEKHEKQARRFADLLCAYVENDLAAAEPDYVRDVLEQIGLTKEEADFCGLGYLFPEEEEV